jgi:lysophospholipase L1-like esterase
MNGMDPANDFILFGHSGATLQDVTTRLRREIDSVVTSIRCGKGEETKLVVVACAGENDIGNGLSLDSSLSSLEAFLDQIFGIELATTSYGERTHIAMVVFLGPKFEPWMEGDASSMDKYSKMSRSFARSCSQHVHTDRMHYVDCLTMFCGDSADLPGAVLGGRACAEPKYFASDRLHLNDEGYRIWKETIETILEKH